MAELEKIKAILAASAQVKQDILEDEDLLTSIEMVASISANCLAQGGKLLFCGNGGSAADAQHLAAEFSGRFYHDREPLFAEALHVNTSYLTAVANDYSYDEVYSRMVKAKGRENDVLFAISTSGNSGNIIKAVEVAKEQNMVVVGMTGESGGKMAVLVDHLLNMPSSDTPRIQEGHIVVGHIICQLVEEEMMRLGK